MLGIILPASAPMTQNNHFDERSNLVYRSGNLKRELVTRRAFIKTAAVGTLFGGGMVAVVRCRAGDGSQQLQVEEIQVPVVDLPSRLDGLRIVQLSDLHLSAIVPLETVQRAVATAEALTGELIVVTGDFVTGTADYAAACAQVLGELRAPLGVYAILGNHDHWTDADQVAHHLTAAGLTVLRNQGRAIARNGGESEDLWLAGLDDAYYGHDDLPAALRGAPEHVPVLLLVHEPDYVDRITGRANGRRVILQLSGHSHGGQVNLPFIGPPILPYLGKKYPRGLQRAGDTWVYTNRGVGVARPAVRFNCPPEVAALTLRRA
jgi:predicted MPP superfamily phosphohydrolase